ncbi:aldo/keto reductase [Streptomyces sp. 4N124]|uniref:aldo/keto reductase n=1 Tax=Streptomyces sp. 4N124 TaxID=3457420 RepID=UPI003FD19118
MANTSGAARQPSMPLRRLGSDGPELPVISLSLGSYFGPGGTFEHQRETLCRAFELGLTHFDVADHYGPPDGAAEQTLGRVLAHDLAPHRDELIISTKSGHPLDDGPQSTSLVDALDKSLRRLGLDYVDIFYHYDLADPTHRPPINVTDQLDEITRSGRARFVGLWNYDADWLPWVARHLRERGIPLVGAQSSYSMFDRRAEHNGLLSTLSGTDLGCVASDPLAEGLLIHPYRGGLPATGIKTVTDYWIDFHRRMNETTMGRIDQLWGVARERGQDLAQMALSWVLRDSWMTSAIVPAQLPRTLEGYVAAVDRLDFTEDELEVIEDATDLFTGDDDS